MILKEKDKKNNKQQFNIPFIFFCLGCFIFFFRSLFFLIIYSQNDERQMIFIGSFKIIDIISNILIFTFLLISCFIDYKKTSKNFAFFKKKYLSMYVTSELIYLFTFCLDIFFTKILFHIITKNNIFDEKINYKTYAFINFIFVTFFSFLASLLQGLARKNMFSEEFD